MNKDFESLIPTAILTAYPRTLTDIPYAKEIFQELNKDKISKDLIVDKLAPELEARYKLINTMLEKLGIEQVLELAAGYSPRGLIFTKNNAECKYVELELETVVKKKINILNSILEIPNNLKIITGNALNENDFKKSYKYFDKGKEIAVINEGLLRYLSFEEKRVVALNVREILSEFGGVWITSDVTPKKFVLNQNINIENFNNNLSNILERNNTSWRFENIEHVEKFFSEIGFNIEIHKFNEVKDKLISPKKLNYDDEFVDKLLEDAIVVIMRLKTE